MNRVVHLCLDVRGALKKRDAELVGFRRPDGTDATPAETRAWLQRELEKGHDVVPVGEACRGFDYRTGCSGHEQKEIPVLFSAPLVRALLAGAKTQTRRVVKFPKGVEHDEVRFVRLQDGYPDGSTRAVWEIEEEPFSTRCRYGVPGDRLWVRETWQAWHRCSYEYDEWEPASVHDHAVEDETLKDVTDSVQYFADGKSVGPWRPSIHMPRWASRIDLEVTGKRFERLHQITEDDARAEGAPAMFVADASFIGGGKLPPSTHRNGFESLWREINGAASWDANPWVEVTDFRRVRP